MNISESIEDPHVFEILSRLRFIAKSRRNQRINVSAMTHEDESLYTSAYRTLVTRDESREKSFRFFKETTEEGIRIIRTRLASERDYDHRIAHVILYSIQEAKKGMQEMVRGEAYSQDTMFVSRVEAYIALLNNCIIDHERRIREVAEKKREIILSSSPPQPIPPHPIPPQSPSQSPPTPSPNAYATTSLNGSSSSTNVTATPTSTLSISSSSKK